jgi:hypothetical protein
MSVTDRCALSRDDRHKQMIGRAIYGRCREVSPIIIAPYSLFHGIIYDHFSRDQQVRYGTAEVRYAAELE